jgi:serine/threonine protein kinase
MTQLGKYEILEEIGRGGFAVVYKARDTTLDRVVALKVLHAHWSTDPDFVTRFRQEARAVANLRHPNIVTVHEAGEAQGQLFIAMEYVPGRTLRELLEREGALPLERASTILEQVADALDYAHQQGVIHRDVKPANIMVEETKRGQRATLMDFGLVKAMAGSTALTSMGTLLGSPEYMAPEQADPERVAEVGPAADRYALGIVAYQMLTGRVPFPGKTPATLNAHEHKPVPRPRSLRPELPQRAAAALLKMLAKTPGDRYPTAAAFVAALRRVTRPEKEPRQPLPKWAWAAGAGLVALALIVLVFVLTGDRGKDREPTDTPTTAAAVAAISTPTHTRAPQPTPTVVASTNTPTALPSPTHTRTPTPRDTPTPSDTPAPALDIGATMVREKDYAVMVYVPGGTFQMGSTDGDPDERPVHSVTLNSFWIDKYEITNLRFNGCVKDGACGVPGCWDNSDVSVPGQPVMCVNWHNAKAYCEWAGARLPTEAEWEYAARGPQGNRYPWGDTFDGERLNFCDASCTQDWKDTRWDDGYALTALAGSFEAGASWCKALDMAGNLFEWVNDWYQADYYAVSPASNPPGPGVGDTKVTRGGAWYGGPNFMRSADRLSLTPGNTYYDGGFRCAVSFTP